MKIKIQDQDTHMNLLIPNFVVAGRLSRKVLSLALSKKGGEMPYTKEQIDRFLQELGRTAKRFKGLTLVEIESSDGEKIFIQL